MFPRTGAATGDAVLRVQAELGPDPNWLPVRRPHRSSAAADPPWPSRPPNPALWARGGFWAVHFCQGLLTPKGPQPAHQPQPSLSTRADAAGAGRGREPREGVSRLALPTVKGAERRPPGLMAHQEAILVTWFCPTTRGRGWCTPNMLGSGQTATKGAPIL